MATRVSGPCCVAGPSSKGASPPIVNAFIACVHGLLLHRHAGGGERGHDGTVAVPVLNLRWRSDGFEIACDNAEKVRVAFALDCCDREAIGHVAATEGIKGDDVRDLMVVAVEQRFGQVNGQPPAGDDRMAVGQWLMLHGDRNAKVCQGHRPAAVDHARRKPDSNGMAEPFVRTFKRDYVAVNPKPDAATVLKSLPVWFKHATSFTPTARSAIVPRASGYNTLRGKDLSRFGSRPNVIHP
jgi:putative transposase